MKKSPKNGTMERVELPLFHFFLFLLLALCCLGLFLLSVYAGMPRERPEGLSVLSVRFQSWAVEQMPRSISLSLRLYAQGDERPFVLDFYEGYERWIPNPGDLCDGADYQAEVMEHQDRCSLYTLTAPDGTPILTYDNYQQGYQNSQGTAIIILRVFAVFGFLFFLLGLFVIRRPDRFPNRVVRLYFRQRRSG